MLAGPLSIITRGFAERHSEPKFDALLFSQLVCREIDAPGAVYSITQTQQADCTVTIVPSGYKRTQGSGCDDTVADITTSSNGSCDGQEIPCLLGNTMFRYRIHKS